MGVMYRQEDFERPLGKEKGHSGWHLQSELGSSSCLP